MSSTERVPLTQQGLDDLQTEVDHLRTVERTRVSERIKEAKEGGDISESGEYEDAKRAQAFLEGRIREIERVLAKADLIDPMSAQQGLVTLGSKVTVDEEGERSTYTIVSAAESGRKNGEMRISNQSKVGAALLGRRVGERVPVATPNGETIKLTIVSVE
ncbi:MAG: transcription elongation factor GreA [Chloroflexia bacterium]|nr:transcription elongation factor GreA [Chloroflexia bacterium]